MARVPPIPACPAVGSIMVRDDDYTGRHEALVKWRNVRKDGHWDLSISTGEQSDIIIASTDFQHAKHHHHWRPADWVWSDEAFMFGPPDMEWNGDEWLPCQTREPAPEDQLPAKSQLPEPQDGEHHATWKSRCRRKFPALECPEGSALLGEAWNDYKSSK